MLVATPGQTNAYTLHNNSNSGATTIPTAPQTSSSLTPASAKKQQTSASSAPSSSAAPKCPVNHNHNSLSNTTATPSLNSAGNSLKHHNNFSFHTPPQKNVSNTTAAKTSKDTNQHSLKNSDNSKPTSFISNLKDTVQKALVSTATSLSRNCNQTATVAIKTPYSTITNSSHNNTSKSTIIATSLSTSSQNVTSSSSATTLNTSSSSSSTILPLTLARKKFAQSISTQPKLHTIPPTILHRYPEERQQASSTDSLQKEMCHFKPIRTVPTTPWKSGSKSRGSSLRFPKANLATTNTEFILKSNCDVTNRMKKKPQTKPTQHESDTGDNGDDNNDEQENKEYCERFKPKPSTLHLSGNSETPNHQSAFVCLVAQMKNLINIQSTKTFGGGDTMDLHKTKSARTVRTKDGGNTAKSVTTTAALKRSINAPVTEIYVRSKKFKSPAPLPKKSDLVVVKDVIATRSNRSNGRGGGGSDITPETSVVTKKTAKTNELSTRVTKAKSRRKLKGAKSKMINIVQVAKTSQAKDKSLTSPTVDAGHIAAGEVYAKPAVQRITRKRKITPDIDARPPVMCNSTTASVAATTPAVVPPTPTLRSSTARARTSVRPSTVMVPQSNTTFKYPDINYSRANQRTTSCFSPPLTRARLKLLLNQEQNNTAAAASVVDVKKRKG